MDSLRRILRLMRDARIYYIGRADSNFYRSNILAWSNHNTAFKARLAAQTGSAEVRPVKARQEGRPPAGQARILSSQNDVVPAQACPAAEARILSAQARIPVCRFQRARTAKEEQGRRQSAPVRRTVR